MLAIIGGTGLYQLEGLENVREHGGDTPFGEPSAPVKQGTLEGRELLFLPRHGAGHRLLPSEINYRANVYALKKAGARQLVSVSAVGSLREEIEPGHFALPNQYFDHTKGQRRTSFFGDGIVAHVSTAQATCSALISALAAAAKACGQPIHSDVTYACVEGPRLGSRAESFFLRDAVKADVVGMTNVPEAFLAREAQLCYATLAISTDYDCWKDRPEEHVTVEQVIARFGKSIGAARSILGEMIARHLPDADDSHRMVLSQSMLTPADSLSGRQKEIADVLMA